MSALAQGSHISSLEARNIFCYMANTTVDVVKYGVTCEMAKKVKVLVVKLVNLIWILGTHMTEGKN